MYRDAFSYMVDNYRLQATNIYPNYKPFTNQELIPMDHLSRNMG